MGGWARAIARVTRTSSINIPNLHATFYSTTHSRTPTPLTPRTRLDHQLVHLHVEIGQALHKVAQPAHVKLGRPRRILGAE